MSNQRFFKTEKAIFIAYYKLKDYPSAKKIARHAKISRSTFYRHHQAANNIPRDYEEFLFNSFKDEIKRYLKNDSNLSTVFLRLLVFISNHKAIIKALLDDGRKESIKRMLSQLRPAIIYYWRPANNSDKTYNIYENEMLGIIETWSKHNFSTTKLNHVLNDTLYLTKTAPKRLAPLVRVK